MKSKGRLKNYVRKTKPKAKNFLNIILGLIIFTILIGTAFGTSFLFGIFFIIGFALSIYNGDLKRKPWKPIAIFIGALIVRIGLNQFFEPILAAKTLMDLAVAALIFISIIVFGWRIKKS